MEKIFAKNMCSNFRGGGGVGGGGGVKAVTRYASAVKNKTLKLKLTSTYVLEKETILQ